MTKVSSLPNSASIELMKWAAILLMVVDHYGKIIILDEDLTFSLIGRLALPLFAVVIALRLAEEPARLTNYLRRTALWAVISQPFYNWAFDHGFFEFRLNIFATFFAGLLVVWLVEKMRSAVPAIARAGYGLLIPAVLLLAATADYGPVGVIMVPCLYLLARGGHSLGLIMALLAFVANVTGVFVVFDSVISLMAAMPIILMISAPALLSWPAYTILSLPFWPKVPRLPGWLFYAFYPAHMAALKAAYILL